MARFPWQAETYGLLPDLGRENGLGGIPTYGFVPRLGLLDADPVLFNLELESGDDFLLEISTAFDPSYLLLES